MQKNLIILAFILVLIGVFSYKSWHDNQQWQKKVNEYREALIKIDEMRQSDEGFYMKIVNDLQTQKSLYAILQDENEELHNKLKADKRKIVSLTNIIAELKGKSGEVPLPLDTIPDDNRIPFITWYPDKDNPFITLSGILDMERKILEEEWKFKPFQMDLVVAETEIGMYEVVTDFPSFFKINSIQVNSIPQESPSKSKSKPFSFLMGAGANKYFKQDYSNLALSLAAGIRIQKVILLLEGDTNEVIGGKLLYEF